MKNTNENQQFILSSKTWIYKKNQQCINNSNYTTMKQHQSGKPQNQIAKKVKKKKKNLIIHLTLMLH